MPVTNPTAATMRLDGGHPALDLVNTIYAPATLEPIDYDVLVTPADLSVFAARTGLAPDGAPSSARAARAARTLRSTLDPVFRALAARAEPPRDALTELERFARRALIPATLAPHATRTPGDFVAIARPGGDRAAQARTGTSDGLVSPGATDSTVRLVSPGATDSTVRLVSPGATDSSVRLVAWAWPDEDPMAPVHRLALAAVDLLADAGELARLHRCDGCCWLYLDHSRGRGRRWCSMADCGGEAKKRRYVEKRRAKRAA